MVFTTTLTAAWVRARAMMGIAVAAFASVAVAYMVEELSPKAFAVAIGGYIAANSLGGIFGPCTQRIDHRLFRLARNGNIFRCHIVTWRDLYCV